MKALIAGGRVYDPKNGLDGAVRDVAVEDGKITTAGAGFKPERRIDAAGCVVMPAGVDVHCHIAGPAVNRARRLLPRGAARLLAPPAVETGRRYAALGYGTAVDAAIAPSSARACRTELADTPSIDKAFLLLLANNSLLLDLLARGDRPAARDVVASLVRRAGAYGIKAVNPGGVALWKSDAGVVAGIDQPLGSTTVTPRAILECLSDAAEDLKLPHPVHVHANRLGAPGNVSTTIETSRALAGRRHHLTHVQFHAYGEDGSGRHSSGAARLMEHFHRTPGLTMDVGQVVFGEAMTLSADLALEHTLWRITGRRYASIDIELETGCGMVPFEYKPRSGLHALQWAVGMEVFLLCNDPWRLALSTDHPNGGSFLAYPNVIAQLMSRDLRAETMRAASADGIARASLADLSREYTLGDVAVVTRAAPARILGLDRKGHLGAGADADITVYDDLPDREAMFRHPRYVLHAGRVVFERGEPREDAPGGILQAPARSTPAGDAALEAWFEAYGSYRLDQLDAVEAAP